MREQTYIVAVDGNAYDKIGFLGAGTEKIPLLYSSDSETVIVNYLIVVPVSKMPSLASYLYSGEFSEVKLRDIFEEDIPLIKKKSTRYEFIKNIKGS